MKFKRIMVAIVFALMATQSIASLQDDDLGGFDFNYSVDLNKQIGLIQVFDDGDRTYFQFTQAEALPDLYAVKKNKMERITYEVRPPYIIALGIASKYMLATKENKTSIYVSYNGKRSETESKKIALQGSDTHAYDATNVVKTETTTPIISELTNQKIEIKNKQTELRVSENKLQNKALVTGTLLNVPFFENSIAISKKAKNDLSRMSSVILQAGRVVVRGRPSVEGDESIANTRALAIKNYLQEIGVNQDTIQILKEPSVKRGKNEGFYLSEVVLLEKDKNYVSSNEEKLASHGTENESTLAKAVNAKPKSEIATSVKIKEPANPPFMGVKLKKGDNIHAAMEAAAKANHFTLNWDGEELYSKYDTSFESGTFEKSVDSLLTAIKVNGYISGNTIYVVVK